MRAVIVAAVLGLPVALALAWSFDLSAHGLRRETGVGRRRPIVPGFRQRGQPRLVAHPVILDRACDRRSD